MENYTYTELCHMAGTTETEANAHGITRRELILFINSKN